MLSRAQQEEIVAAVHMYIEEAERHFQVVFTRPLIKFDLRGVVAGYAHWTKRCLQFNGALSAENFEETLYQTVPHEVAHWIECAMIFQHGKWRVERAGTRRRVHGRQWASVMRVFGCEPTRCHSMDVSRTRVRRARLWAAKCGCKVWNLTTHRRNKMQTGTRNYRCPTCKGRLVLTGEEIA